MNKEKVSEIDFHITRNELDDFIMRAAELIKEGYNLYSIEYDSISTNNYIHTEPNIHIKFTRWHI